MSLGFPPGRQELLSCFGLFQAAQRSQKQSTELFQCLYFKDRDPETEERRIADGVIYSIRTNGVLVFIPRYVTSQETINYKQYQC